MPSEHLPDKIYLVNLVMEDEYCVCVCVHICMTNDVYFRSGTHTQRQTKRANIIIRWNILSLLLSMCLVAKYRDSMNKRVV